MPPEVDHLMLCQNTTDEGQVFPDVMTYHLSFTLVEPNKNTGFSLSRGFRRPGQPLQRLDLEVKRIDLANTMTLGKP